MTIHFLNWYDEAYVNPSSLAAFKAHVIRRTVGPL